jgi:hypothetical protein
MNIVKKDTFSSSFPQTYIVTKTLPIPTIPIPQLQPENPARTLERSGPPPAPRSHAPQTASSARRRRPTPISHARAPAPRGSVSTPSARRRPRRPPAAAPPAPDAASHPLDPSIRIVAFNPQLTSSGLLCIQRCRAGGTPPARRSLRSAWPNIVHRRYPRARCRHWFVWGDRGRGHRLPRQEGRRPPSFTVLDTRYLDRFPPFFSLHASFAYFLWAGLGSCKITTGRGVCSLFVELALNIRVVWCSQ